MKKGMLRAAMAVVLVLAAVGSCSNPASGLGRRVDVNPPSILIDSPVSGTNFKGVQAFVGRYFDDLEVATVEVSFDNGTTFLPATLTNAAGKLTEGTWNLNYDSTAFPDGGKLVVVRVTDKAGRATTTNPSIYTTDNTPPTVLVTSPADYGTARPDLSSVLSLEGRAYDNDYSPLQIQKVFVTVLNPDGTPASVKKEAKGKESWSVQFLFPANNEETNDDFPGGLSDQPAGIVYGYSVEAVDGAGNLNNHIYHAADLFKLLQSGQLFPSMNALGTLDQKGTGTLEGVGANPTGLTFDELKALRITKDSGVSSGFKFFRDVDKPVVEVTNLIRSDDQMYPVINSRSSISGTVTDDKKPFKWDPRTPEDYDSGYLTAVVTPAGSAAFTILPAAPPKTRGQGNQVNFQFDLVYPAGHSKAGQTLDNGQYSMVIKARDADWVTGSTRNEGQISVNFRVDNSAPTFLSVAPGSGAELGGAGNKVELTVVVEDDSPDLSLEVDHGGDKSALTRLAAGGIVPVGAGTEVVKDNKTYYQKTFSVTIPLTDTQLKVFAKLAVKDVAGFAGYSSDLEYSIDKIPPEVTIDDIPGSISLFVGGGKATASVSGTGLGSNEVYFLVQAQGAAAPVAGTGTWLKATGNTKWNGTITLDSTTAFEGAYSLYAYSQDPAGNRSAVAREDFMVDQAAPSVTPVGLNASQITYKTTTGFNIEATITDSFGLKTWNAGGVLIIVDNGATLGAITKTGDVYSRTFSGVDGTYNVTIVAEDLAGKTTTITRTIVVDTKPPKIIVANLTAPPGVSSLEVASFVIRGTAEDDSGTADVEYSLNGGTWTNVTGLVTWEVSVSGLTEGPTQNIKFRARDIHDADFTTAGHFVVSDTYIFNLDLANPTLIITTKPADNAFLKSNFILEGTAQDKSGLKSLKISLDAGTTWPVDISVNSMDDTIFNWSETITVPAGGTSDGLKSVRVQTMDQVNKVTTQSFNVTFDTLAPTFTPRNLVNGQLIQGLPFAVDGSWSDNGGSGTSTGSAKMEYSLDGTTYSDLTVTASSWNGNIPFVQGLNRSLYLRSTDRIGNTSTALHISGLTVDTDLPASTVLHDGTAVWTSPQYKNASFVLSGSATDTLGVASVTVTANPAANAGIGALTVGGASGDTTRGWSVTINPTADGTYQYTVTVTDIAGRIITESRSITRDTTPPQISVLNLNDGDPISTSSYPISGTASDANGLKDSDDDLAIDTDAVEYRLDANGDGDYGDAGDSDWGPVSSAGQSWTQSVSGLTEGGSIRIQFRAKDDSGLTTTLPVISFGLDLLPPALSVTSIDGTLRGAWTDGTAKRLSFDIIGTAQDPNGIQSLKLSLDGGATYSTTITGSSIDGTLVNWTQNVSVPINGAGDGLKAVRIRAIDNYNKVTEESFTVRFDSSAPNFTINNLVDGQLITNSPFTANGTWTDNGGSGTSGGSAMVQYRIGAGVWTNVTDTLTTSAWGQSLALSEGLNQTISFRATDTVGNQSGVTSVTSVNVDTGLPATAVNHDGAAYTEGSWGTTVYKKAAFQLRGTASDTLGVASVSVTATPAGTAGVGAVTLNAGTTSRTWSVPVTPTAVGSYEFTVTVTDTAGRTTVEKRTVVYDNAAPTVSFVSPAASSWSNSASVVVNGTSDDGTGSGIRKAFYVLDNTGLAVPADPTVDANWTGAGWTAFAGTSSFNATLSGLSEGSRTLRIASVDQAGNASTPANRTFGVDLNDPTVAVDAGVTVTLTNADWTVFGTAGDTNSLSTTVITATKNTVSQGVLTNAGTAAAWTYTLDSDPNSNGDHTNDGDWVFTITATDAAGKTKVTTKSMTMDTTKPTAAVTAPADSTYHGGPILAANGTVSDASNQIASVQYRVDGGTWTAVSGGTLSWFANIDLDTDGAGADNGLAVGSHTLEVRATDAAGNVGDASTSLTFIVDQANPTLTETAAGGNVSRSAAFALSGVATDDYQLNTIAVTQNGTAITTNPGTFAAGTWSVTGLPRTGVGLGTTTVASGIYVYSVTLTDKAGKTSTVNRTIEVDVTAPDSLTITAPGAAQTGTNALSGAAYTFRGTSSDAGVGMAKIWYVIDTNATAPAGTAGYTDVATAGNWSFTLDLDTDGAGVDTGLAEGLSYYLHVKAEDAAGNVQTAATSVLFDLDQSNPTLTETGINTTALSNRNAGFSLTGVLSDTLASPAVTISVTQNGTPVSTSGPGVVGTTWTLNNLPRNPSSIGTQLLEDGIFEYAITANDGAGKTTIVNRTVRYDSTAPTLVVTSPAASEQINTATTTLSGTVNDGAGSGVASVEFSSDNSSWTAAIVVGGTWSYGGYALGAEGAKTLYVRATDTVGNVNALGVINFYYDLAAPSLTAGTPGAITNADVVLSGTASDSNALASVVITATKNGVAQGTLHTDAASPDSWSYTHTAAGNDGTWVYTITATDAAGRTTTTSRTVLIDTIKPVVSITLPLASTYVGGTDVTATGSVTELNNLTSVEYTVNGSDWFAVSSGTSSWSINNVTGTLGEGVRTLQVRATDQAGNVSNASSRTLWVDTLSPGLTETGIGSGAVYKNALFTLSGDISDNVDLASITVTESKNGAAATTVYSNTYTGLLGGTPETSVGWSVASLPSGGASTGNYEYVITVADASGKTRSLTRTVTVDTTVPALAINSVLPIILPARQVNGWITLSANASDENGLDGVKYFTRTTATTPAWTDGDGTLDTVAPYTNAINTTALTDSTTYYLHVLTRDKSGNVSAVVYDVAVSQASDLPAISVESPGNGDAMGADKKVRGTFSDDDGVAANTAIFYYKKSTDGSWSNKTITNSSSASQLVSWTIDLTTELGAGGDGTYQYYVRVTDDATLKSGLGAAFTELGSSGSPRTFTFDNSPPTVSATLAKTPDQGAYKLGDAITISWTASDASGLQSQVFDIDGVSTGLGSLNNPSGTNYNVVYTVPASTSGTKTFTLVVTDTTGRSTTRTLNITVDVDAPTVENALTLDPAFVGSTPNGAFTLRGTAADNRGLNNVQVQITGGEGTLTWTNATLSNGNWSYAIANSAVYESTSGNITVEVRAYDLAGNVSTTQSFVKAVDQAADKPVVTLISPVAASSYGTTVQVSGTASDDDNLADLNDNSVIDPTAIEVEYWQGLGAHTTVNPTIVGSGRNANFNLSLTGLAGGTDWYVRVRAQDDAGTWGEWSSNVNFTVNSGAPNLNISTSVPTYTANPTLALSGTVEDSDGVQYVRVRINGGAWNTVNPDIAWGSTTAINWTYNLNLGTDGLKTLEFEATDGGFLATQQKSTTLDSTAPAGAFDSQFRDDPTGSFLSTSLLNKTVRITGSVTELNLADSNPIRIRIDADNNGDFVGPNDLDYTPVSGTFVWSYVWNTAAVPNSNATLQLEITDKAGNVTSSITKLVTLNQAADTPVVTQAFNAAPTAGDAGLNVLGATLKVSGTLSDDDGFNANTVLLSLDGGAFAIAGTNTSGTTATWEYTWGALAQGQHYYSVQATDRNGAVQTLGPTYFLVDTANPSLAITTPAAGAKVKAGTLSITGTASDAGGLGTTPLSLTLRHSNTGSPLHNTSYTPAVVAGDWSQDVTINTGSLDGTLYLDLVLTDRAGKQSSLTRAITIDTTSPTLNLNYPSFAAYINGLVDVTGTADDLNGLSDVTLQILGPVSKLPVANISRSGTTLAAWTFPLNSFTYATSTYGEDVNADGKLWRVWFRLVATDNSGNITELLVDDEDADTNLDDYPWFFIDTDGDKPTIAVTQPKNGDKIGGIVSMFGTATDDDGAVMQVEVQIDFNGDGDYLDSRDLNNNDSDSNPATGIDLGANQDIFGNTVKIGPSAHKWEDESAWYVVNVSNNSWTQELNSNGELYPTATGGSGLINMRVRSRDQFGLASEILTRSITLDQTFPRIENVTPLDQSYQSGTFNLVAEFGDNIDLDLGSLSQVRINIAKTGYQTLTAGPNSGVGHPYALVADLADPQNGFDLNYPIDTNVYFPGSSGILYVDLYVKDESSYVNQRSFTFYVDNQAPTGIWSDSTTRPDGSSLRNGMITVNGVDKTYVEGNYSDSGAVSGISHIEVYLVRGGAVRNIKANGTWGGATSTETIDVENYSLGTNTWTTVPNSVGQLLVTHASLGSDYVIRVDKPTEMSDLGFGTDIDGDGYTEYQGIYEGKARWRAYFDSQYLPDGIADLHYVIYDLAGNKVHRMRQVFIANSGPRVDQIQVGSDLNANGTVANATGLNEIGDYYNTAPVVNRSDFQKIKNSKLYLGVYGSDPNGTNQGVKQIFVDVYDAAGTTLFGNARTSALNPASGDDTITLTPTPGVSPWTTAYSGGTANFTLKVTVRDNDDISAVQFVKVSIIDPSDTTPPVVTLNALSVNDQDLDLGHLELQSDNTVAIWNTIKAAYGNDNDPKVSGQIKVKGTITDNNLVTSVQATSENNPTPALASWVGGVLTAVTGSGFTIDTLSVSENGTTVTFTYTWNTAQVTGTAGLNKVLSLKAFDGFLTATGTRAASTITVAAWAGRNIAVGAPIYLFGGTSPTTTTVAAFNNGTGQVTLTNTTIATDNTSASVGWNLTHTASQQVDVVPYIKTIRRDSAIYNNYRSRQGWFGLRQNEANVTVTGFNIFNTTADTITFVGQAPVLPAGSTATTVVLPQASTATISTGAVSMTVNGQPSINNLNDNSKAWNIEATASAAFDGSALWTDDRYVHVWRSDDNQAGTNRGYFTGSADPEYPAMTINTAGILYGSWSNYADSSVYYGVNNGAATEFFNSYDPSEHTDVSFGNRVTVVWNANTYGNGAWNSTGAGGVYVYDSQANAALDSNWGNAYESELLYHDQKLMQFVNQRVVNQGDNIHISYYDTDTKSLKYWYNTSGNNPAYAQTWVNIDGGSDTHDGTRLVANGSARVATAGEYSAIAVTPTTNYPVIAYYDGSSQTVKLARASAVNPAFGAWTRQTVMTNGVDPNYQFSGKYITMKIDSAGYLHLAFFRNSTGDLIYLKSTNNPTNGTTNYTFGNSVIVDSIGSVGVWADLTLNGTNPVISYLDSSLVNTFDGIKMAYYDPALEALSGDTAGQPDTSDGWETMNAALAYEVESVRTSVETDTGTNFWQQAIGYSSTDFYRIGYYVR